MLYPLLFKPYFQHYLWGGQRLQNFYNLPELTGEPLAESWLLSSRKQQESFVRNGTLKGKSLSELCRLYGQELIGPSYVGGEDFPLLIKLIDAKQNLSIQVHPDDAWAQANLQQANGKSEAWYILDAPAASPHLICGLKPTVTKAVLAAALETPNCEELLQYVQAPQGSVINVPAGMVHAVTAGYFVYEVQQNSDTTFRLYDYQRKDADGNLRKLHIDESLACTRYDCHDQQVRFDGLNLTFENDSALLLGNFKRRLLIFNRCFSLEKWDLSGVLGYAALSGFKALTVIDGELLINYASADGFGHLELHKGDTVLLPASLRHFSLQASHAICLSSTLPQAATYKQLTTAYSAKEIATHVALEPLYTAESD